MRRKPNSVKSIYSSLARDTDFGSIIKLNITHQDDAMRASLLEKSRLLVIGLEKGNISLAKEYLAQISGISKQSGLTSLEKRSQALINRSLPRQQDKVIFRQHILQLHADILEAYLAKCQ